jgi:uncharacterized protein YbbK (DUF523 family)/uncharacterized protein YbgA (DUF1722 family)
MIVEKIPVATSSCLLGNNVRFNGANCHKKFLTKDLSEIFNLTPICPEVAAKLGVPRPPIRLVQAGGDSVIAESHKNNIDLTQRIEEASNKILDSLSGICGYILKKGSPSCGSGSVKLYNLKQGILSHKEDGVFVKALRNRYPLLPIEDEGRLNDAYLREHFIKRVYLTHEINKRFETLNTISELMDFHTRHKILLRLHHSDNQKELGNLLSNHKNLDIEKLKREYKQLFLASFVKVASRGKHHSILQRMLREINKLITKEERASFQSKLKLFYDEKLPLAVPVEMIKHYLIRYDIKYLKNQSYLNLYPDDLALMSNM